jgi:hypothetical protein
MAKGEITTATGRNVNPLKLRPEDIDIQDIAHALSMTCRFNGHCRKFYSVAEHSVLVSYLCPRKFALIGLLHDAAEAYLGDIPSPVKPKLKQFKTAENRAEQAIARKFGVASFKCTKVHTADKRALRIEMGFLLPGSRRVPGHDRIMCLTPAKAKRAFLARFSELVGSA